MKKQYVAMMVVILGLSSVVCGSTLFADDFSSGSWTGWSIGYAGTGTVTIQSGYARLYEGYPNWGYSSLSTQDAFSIDEGLEFDVTLMFSMYNSGTGSGLTYRPSLLLKDGDSGAVHVGVYSPFSSGATSAPMVMQTRNSGVLADTHTTPSVGTSNWYRVVMNVYSDHATVSAYDNSDVLVDAWSATYDSMESVRLAFKADCPGWWPASELLINDAQISSIPEPISLILLGLGSVLCIRRK